MYEETDHILDDLDHAITKERRFRKWSKAIMWGLVALAGAGTYLLSGSLESRDFNLASVIDSLQEAKSYEIVLYDDRAEPAVLEARAGDDISFVVRGGGTHNLAEERSDLRDARLQSGEFGPGESYTLVFSGKGEFSFYDRQNPDIQVTIRIK
jgi:plastocyanin